MSAYHICCWSPREEVLLEFDLDEATPTLLDDLVEAGRYAVALHDGRAIERPLILRPAQQE